MERPKERIVLEDDGGLDSTPELNPMPQTEKGGIFMKKHRFDPLSRQLHRASIAMGNALARLYGLCYRIQFSGIGVSLIPGLLTCNISFRAGGSGRARHLHPIVQHS